MNPELLDRLVRDHPLLYRNGLTSDCPDEWYELIRELSGKLEVIARGQETLGQEPILAVQVKWKFGGLRFYIRPSTSEARNLIMEAEQKSYTIPELNPQPALGETPSPMSSSSNDRNLFPPDDSQKELGEAALSGFYQIAADWGLSRDEQMTLLGGPSDSTFLDWEREPKVDLSDDTIERISYILGIWKALRILIPDDLQARAWVTKPNDNPMFGGQAPLSLMLKGRLQDLAEVRHFLDSRMGVW